MKKITTLIVIPFFVMALTHQGRSQQRGTNGNLINESLYKQIGLANASLGDPFHSFKNMKFLQTVEPGEKYYSRVTDDPHKLPKLFDRYEISVIRYTFYKNRLEAVSIVFEVPYSDRDTIINDLNARYGNSTDGNNTWYGKSKAVSYSPGSLNFYDQALAHQQKNYLEKDAAKMSRIESKKRHRLVNSSAPISNSSSVLTSDVIKNLASYFLDGDQGWDLLVRMAGNLGIGMDSWPRSAFNTADEMRIWALAGQNGYIKKAFEQAFRSVRKFNNSQLDWLQQNLGLTYDESRALQGK